MTSVNVWFSLTLINMYTKPNRERAEESTQTGFNKSFSFHKISY